MNNKEQLSKQAESGCLTLKDNKLIYYFKTEDDYTWVIKVNEIVLIAEYTNQNGPFADDYFIYFVSNEGLFYQCSFYAVNCFETINQLEKLLDDDLSLELSGSTDFESRIIWPLEIKAKPFYEYSSPDKPNNGILSIIWWYIYSRNITVESKLTSEIKLWIDSKKEK